MCLLRFRDENLVCRGRYEKANGYQLINQLLDWHTYEHQNESATPESLPHDILP